MNLPQDYFQQALALHQAGQLAQAQSMYQQILAAQPNHFAALHMLGVIASQTNNFQRAVDLIGQAIQIQPGNPTFYFNRANALKELSQFQAARASYEKAIVLKPDYVVAHHARAVLLADMDQHQAALAGFDNAIALAPNDAFILNNRGNTLQKLKQFQLAADSYQRAINIMPNFAQAFNNLGNTLHELGQLDAAVAMYDKAVSIDPEFDDAQWNKSYTLLTRGDFANGLPLHEKRWKSSAYQALQRNFTQPLWLGGQSLANKTILLHSEQGLGDTIQFCRYAKMVAALGARVILEVPHTLVGLLKTIDGVNELVARGSVLPPFDYHCPLLSLPLAFQTDLASIPSGQRYVSADPSKVEQWKLKLGAKTQPRVGVVWCSTSKFPGDAMRSLRLQDFARALTDSGCEYICLQKEINAADKKTLKSLGNICFFGEDLNDFSDTAALIECLDIVVGTCTSVPHLACALGKPTYLLLSYAPDWRWLLNRNDSPWYPSAKLFRQESPGAWDGVFANVKVELEKFLAKLS